MESTLKMLREAIERGIKRGEVRPDAANSYVFDAIPAMMMYRSKMCGSEWTDVDPHEMIDQLMVPLLRRSAPEPGYRPDAGATGGTGVSRAVPGGVR